MNRMGPISTTSRRPASGLCAAMRIAVIAFGSCVPVTVPLHGQQSLTRLPLELRVLGEGLVHRVVLVDGTVHYARIASGGDPVRIGLESGGVLELPVSLIVRVERVRGRVVDGEYWPEDANHTRLLFGPTARTLPPGKGTLNAYYGVLPFIAVGVTERFTLAAGTRLLHGDGPALIPIGADASEAGGGRLAYVAPKLQLLKIGRFEHAAGAIVFFETGDVSRPRGMAYGVTTWSAGFRTGLTSGAGWRIATDGMEASPTIMVGADHRLNRRFKLITENYRFSSGELAGSTGVRVIGERISGDIAAARRWSEGRGRAFPVFNVSYGW